MDDEVAEWVRTQLLQEPGVATTLLLTRFRGEGRACLDTRFRRIVQALRLDVEKRLIA